MPDGLTTVVPSGLVTVVPSGPTVVVTPGPTLVDPPGPMEVGPTAVLTPGPMLEIPPLGPTEPADERIEVVVGVVETGGTGRVEEGTMTLFWHWVPDARVSSAHMTHKKSSTLTRDHVEGHGRAAAWNVSGDSRIGESSVDLTSGILAKASLTAEEGRVRPCEAAAGGGSESSNDAASLAGVQRDEKNAGVNSNGTIIDEEGTGGA